jgi:hypothetical protein
VERDHKSLTPLLERRLGLMENRLLEARQETYLAEARNLVRFVEAVAGCLPTGEVAPVCEAVGLHLCKVAHDAHHREQDTFAHALFSLGLPFLAAPRERSRVLATFAEALCVQGDLAAARRAFEESLEAAEETGIPAVAIAAAARLGDFLHFIGDCPAAQRYLEDALERATTADTPGLNAGFGEAVLRHLGFLFITRGQYGQARLALDRSREMALSTGDLHTAADSDRGIALLHLHTGNLAVARALLERGRLPWRERGHRRWQAVYALHLAEVCRYEGDDAGVLCHVSQAEAHLEHTRSPTSAATARYLRGYVALRQGDAETALHHLIDALRLQRRYAGRRHLLPTLEAIAAAQELRGRAASALELLAIADAERERFVIPVPPVERAGRACLLARLSERFLPARYEAARSGEAAPSLEQVVARLVEEQEAPA